MTKKSKIKYLIILIIISFILVLSGFFIYTYYIRKPKLSTEEMSLIKQGYVNTGEIIENGIYSCASIAPECGYCSFQGGVAVNGYCYEKPK